MIESLKNETINFNIFSIPSLTTEFKFCLFSQCFLEFKRSTLANVLTPTLRAFTSNIGYMHIKYSLYCISSLARLHIKYSLYCISSLARLHIEYSLYCISSLASFHIISSKDLISSLARIASPYRVDCVCSLSRRGVLY